VGEHRRPAKTSKLVKHYEQLTFIGFRFGEPPCLEVDHLL
jgi:hypothetical protein